MVSLWTMSASGSLASKMSNHRNEQDQKKKAKRQKKKLSTGLCIIWKQSQGSNRQFRGNGVLIRNRDFVEKQFRTDRAEYCIWTSRKALGEDESSNSYIQLCRVTKPSEGKDPVPLKDIVLLRDPRKIGESLFFVLHSKGLKSISNSVNDRAFDVFAKSAELEENVSIHCFREPNSKDSFEQPGLAGEFTITEKPESGNLVINISEPQISNIPPGSVVVNRRDQVLGVYAGGNLVSTLWGAAGTCRSKFTDLSVQSQLFVVNYISRWWHVVKFECSYACSWKAR